MGDAIESLIRRLLLTAERQEASLLATRQQLQAARMLVAPGGGLGLSAAGSSPPTEGAPAASPGRR